MSVTVRNSKNRFYSHISTSRNCRKDSEYTRSLVQSRSGSVEVNSNLKIPQNTHKSDPKNQTLTPQLRAQSPLVEVLVALLFLRRGAWTPHKGVNLKNFKKFFLVYNPGFNVIKQWRTCDYFQATYKFPHFCHLTHFLSTVYPQKKSSKIQQ